MFKFMLKRLLFNLAITAIFLVGFNILTKEISPLAALGVALIGLNAMLYGQFAHRFGGRWFKPSKE